MLLIDPEKCNGCRTCEMVCSLKHSHGCSTIRSRVSVITLETQDLSLPIMCQHCEIPSCQEVCPTRAISRDMTTNAVIINPKKCLGCKMCVYVCPFGATSIDPISRVIIKCDLCEGDPECAKFCAYQAIQFIRYDEMGATKRRTGAQKMLNAIAQVVI